MRFYLPCSLILACLFIATLSAQEKETPKVLKAGDAAPDVELPATQIDKALPDKKDAKTLNLKDLQGKKNVVLFFYPKAMTPGCTKESCGFSDISGKLAEVDTVAIGISTDTVDAQQKFTDKEKLSVPLLADADKKVSKAFGVLGNSGMAQRQTFVIDKKGVVRKVYDKVDPTKHPEEVLIFVKENLVEKK